MDTIRTYTINEDELPLVIEPAKMDEPLGQLLEDIEQRNGYYRKKILQHGGLLFRNFPVDNAEDFTKVLKALNLGEFVNYIGGGSPRTKIKDSVYTSTEAPPSIKMQLHNELSYADNYPKHIYFYCDIPPKEGGETTIGDARKVLKKIKPELKETFLTKNGFKYISRYYYKSKIMDFVNKLQTGHKTWRDVFETDKKEEVEAQCKKNNIGCKWNVRDWLEISRHRPYSITHPDTQEAVWFNQIYHFDYNPRFIGWPRYIGLKLFYFRRHTLIDEVCYADNTKIPRKDMYHVHDVLDDCTIKFPWQKGDILVLDNILAMHGRAPFKGERRILTAMTK